jgi:hypothetical protein
MAQNSKEEHFRILNVREMKLKKLKAFEKNCPGSMYCVRLKAFVDL